MFPQQPGGVQYNILDRGFKNVRVNGEVVGFQVLVRSSYYRGVYIPILDGFEVEVDGQKFAGKQITAGFNGKTYEQSEFEKADNARWQWGDPAVLTVRQPGGLKPGFHDVTIVSRERISYMPTIPTVRRYNAKLALVR